MKWTLEVERQGETDRGREIDEKRKTEERETERNMLMLREVKEKIWKIVREKTMNWI
jgi:hypothetical protein